MGVKVKRKAHFVSPWSQRGSESGLRVKVTSDKQGKDDGVKKKRKPSSQTFLSRLRSHQDIPPLHPHPHTVTSAREVRRSSSCYGDRLCGEM